MFSKRRRKYYTITEIHGLISTLEQKSKRLPEIIGFRSSDTCKNFKELITLCNSLSIVFVQYDLIQDCLIMLKIATEADTNLCKYGTVLDRLWQNRILTFNNLAFLYHKVNQPSDSLKFLYEAHGLAQNIKESGGVTNYDLSITTNILTFIVLWKLKRYEQASVYVELAGEILNSISSGKKQTRFSEQSGQNIFGILAIFMAGLAVKLEGSFKKSVIILEDCLKQLQNHELAVRMVLKDLLRDLYKKKNTNSSVLYTSNSEVSLEDLATDEYFPKIPSEVLANHVKQNYDWLITKDLETLFFITCIVPFISPSTPLIRLSELEKSRDMNKNLEYSENSFPINEMPEYSPDIELPQISLPKTGKKVPSRQSYIRKTNSKERSPQRSQAWWEKKPDTRHQSEPRGSSYSDRNKFTRMATPFKASQASVRNANVPRHIMLEFNPTQGSHMPVELIPMPPSRAKFKPHVLDPFYQDICD